MQKLIIKSLTGIFLFLVVGVTTANSALFGPDNYDECMSDGKFGRSNNELGLLESKCRSKFPVLPKLYSMKNSSIVCIRDDNDDTLTYTITSKGMALKNSKITFPIYYRSSEKVVVKGNIVQKINTKQTYPSIFTLDNLYGKATIEFNDKVSSELIRMGYECIEK